MCAESGFDWLMCAGFDCLIFAESGFDCLLCVRSAGKEDGREARPQVDAADERGAPLLAQQEDPAQVSFTMFCALKLMSPSLFGLTTSVNPGSLHYLQGKKILHRSRSVSLSLSPPHHPVVQRQALHYLHGTKILHRS